VRLTDPPSELVEDLHPLLQERSRESAPARTVVEALAGILRKQAHALAGEAPAG
jgi:hypothetical protein